MTNEKAEARDRPAQKETPRLDGANELSRGFPVDPPSALGGDGPTGREGMERTGHTAREGVRSLRETGRANLPATGVEGDWAAEGREGHEVDRPDEDD
jgi:hypothetical protein